MGEATRGRGGQLPLAVGNMRHEGGNMRPRGVAASSCRQSRAWVVTPSIGWSTVLINNIQMRRGSVPSVERPKADDKRMRIDARWAGRVQTVLPNKANRALERAFVPQLSRALGQAFVPQFNRALGQAFIAAPCKIPRRRLQRPGIASHTTK